MNPTSRFQKILAYIRAHKIMSAFVLAIVLFWGYREYQSLTSTSGETRYVLGTVAKDTIVSSVTGTGQVSTSDQVDIKPQVSGNITGLFVVAGQFVNAGQTIATIDDTTAKQSIADAETALTQAKLQYQQDTAQAPIDYQKLQETLASAQTDLATTYNDTYNTLSNTYLDLPATVTGMQNILYGYDLSQSKSQWNIDVLKNSFSSPSAAGVFADVAASDYKTASDKYASAIIDYKTLTRYSSKADIEKELASSIDTTTSIAQALQSELNLLDAIIQDAQTYNHTLSPMVTTLRTNTRNYLATANTDLSAMLNQQKTLDTTKQAIIDDQHNLDIFQIGNPTGSNPISLQSSQYSIADQERKLQQMKDDLSNYTITAPFAGTIAVLDINQYSTASSGSAIATIITSQKIAEVSLNEIDAAKVKIGQKATLTFDAVDGLSIAGSVAEIDTIGTVSQGVVSYTVKIAFDTQDSRVKSGMSVSAAIITAVKQNILTVPNGAIKTQGGTSYVETFNPAIPTSTGSGSSASTGVVSATAPIQQVVETGLSNDTITEIVSGLTEGQQIVVRTIAGSASTSSQAPSILNAVRTGGGPRAITGR